MRAVRQIATPPSSLCKEPTALLHNIEKKNSQPKRNPAPTPGSIPLRSAPPRRNCKRSAGSIPLDPLNRQHSFCLGAPPLPSCSPTGAVAPLHARSPSRVGGGRATASTRDRPDSSRNRRSAQTKSRSTRRRSLPRPPGINFPTEFEPRESNGAFASPWRTLESHFSRPDNRFCAIKADARGPRPGKRTSVESKEYEPKKRNKTENTGPILTPARVPNTLKDPPPPPPDRSLLNEEKKGRGKKEKSRQAALISKNTVKSRRNIFPRFRVAPA